MGTLSLRDGTSATQGFVQSRITAGFWHWVSQVRANFELFRCGQSSISTKKTQQNGCVHHFRVKLWNFGNFMAEIANAFSVSQPSNFQPADAQSWGPSNGPGREASTRCGTGKQI